VVLAIDDLPEGKPQPSAFLGDDLDADVRGARKAGLASVWFRRPEGVALSHNPVPGVRVALDLAEVRRWLDTPVAPSRG
jgi:FMN phosphatase YigB (HAD superfamily)